MAVGGRGEEQQQHVASTYLDQPTNKVQRQSVAQHRLDEHAQGENVDPDHHALAPPGPCQPQRLAPDLALVATRPLDLLALLLLAALDVLVVARRPFHLAALVLEVGAVLLERRDGEQRELVVLGDLDRRAGHHHGRQRLVALEEIALGVVGHRDEVRLEVFGVLDEELGVDDRREGFRREVSAVVPCVSRSARRYQVHHLRRIDLRLLPLQGRERRLDRGVLGIFTLHIIVDADQLLDGVLASCLLHVLQPARSPSLPSATNRSTLPAACPRDT